MQQHMSILLRYSRILMVALISVMLLGGAGCKSKKKAAEAAAAAEEKARIEREMEEKRRAEETARRRAEEERLAAERARAEASENTPEKKLANYFDAIASGSDASANRNIQEALGMFASPETPVLIIISEENGQKDYDRPTTIEQYLNYLKDTNKNMNRVFEVSYDAAGKINALELTKDY